MVAMGDSHNLSVHAGAANTIDLNGSETLVLTGMSSKMEISSADEIGSAEGFRSTGVLGQMSKPAKVAGSRNFEAGQH
jgi:hypothetical protein